jgi:hypothetical protein
MRPFMPPCKPRFTPPRRPPRSPIGPAAFLSALLTLAAAGCGPGASGDRDLASDEAIAALEARLADRFSPGLHSLMIELQHRHATLWFAGDAGNWPLADYFLHELEELIEDIDPEYGGVPVADLLGEMTLPVVEALEGAVEEGDRAAFARHFDQLTAACNACHVASGREAIVVQRPTAPPLTNLRYLPRP